MIQAREWPVRVMYILIAAALAIGLLITAAPAQKVSAAADDVKAEWERVPTPSWDGFVLADNSTIIDYALDADGEVAYAVVRAHDEEGANFDYRLLKSDNHAATWTDITNALEDVDDANTITQLARVATDWVDPEFVAVALEENKQVRVYFSTDGGTTFESAGQVIDTVSFDDPDDVSDLAVSYESGGKRDIAIGGADNKDAAALFRSTVDGDNPGAWKDATLYDGWDNVNAPAVDIDSYLVTDIIFSPSWVKDKTILVTTVEDGLNDYNVHLQCGSWGVSPGWNEKSSLGIEAVLILDDEDLPTYFATWDARAIAGITLPSNYNSKNTGDRVLWVWVNYYDPSSGDPRCMIARVDNNDADDNGPQGQIKDGKVWLTNISYKGTIAEGEAIAGVLGDGAEDYAICCKGVQVYRNDNIVNMIICCEPWKSACKPPTGRAAMAVSYVGEDKAYAVALQGDDRSIGGVYDEGAWSVTFDDGDTWNQLSLIDTWINYLSDVAVSPDCNKTMLVSVNMYEGDCGCDSVWLHAEELPEAEEYSGQWLRTWCGILEGDNDLSGHAGFPFVLERGLLRLAPEETDGMNVYLVDRMSGNVYWNDLETLACWDPIPSTEVTEIVDLVAQDVDTLFALDYNGEVAMFDDDEWQEPVDSEVTAGWTIAVHGDDILVGGQDGDVSHSADGGETFTELDDVVAVPGAHVTVAFDTYFDQNDTIYAALANAGKGNNGIYLWVIGGEPEEWNKLGANDDYDYTGLVLDRPSPSNPYTSAETGGVLYASYRGTYCDECGCPEDGDYCWYTGVARCLTPIVELCCGVGEAEWDYLTWDLRWDSEYADFCMPPQALKICGCLTADSNSKLFAIDGEIGGNYYDMDEAQEGTVWTFEDCYAKKGVELTSPADGFVVPANPCECYNNPFTLRWDRLCDACCYEIQFALDEDFTELVTLDMGYPYVIDDLIEEYYGFDCYCPDAPMTPSAWMGQNLFTCEYTYYWRVRASQAETCQEIHSWWSEPQSFTIAPSRQAAAIDLVSPVPGATGVAPKNVGFSWNLLATADAFDWVLDDTADLSSPIQTKTGLTAKACTYTGTLAYGTTYYWQVIAYNDGAPISQSAIGTFTTAATGEFCCPQCGLCFDTQAALQAHIDAEHPAQPATPFWVWVVIAIGAVLVIVVIVLIFRTRRV